MSTVGEYMSSEVAPVRGDASLVEAAQQMRVSGVGGVPVLDADGEGRVGILTERDIVVRVLAEERDPRAAVVRDAATLRPVMCGPEDDVATALVRMREEEVQHLPVVEQRRVAGVISLADIVFRQADQVAGEDRAAAGREPVSAGEANVNQPGSEKEPKMSEPEGEAEWNAAEWHGKTLVDREGRKIGKLQDVYVDVETDEPQFATVKEGFIGRHLTFVPLGGVKVGPDELQVPLRRSWSKAHPTSSSMATSSPRPTSRRSTTTTSSTTRPPPRRAGDASPFVDERPADRFAESARDLLKEFWG